MVVNIASYFVAGYGRIGVKAQVVIECLDESRRLFSAAKDGIEVHSNGRLILIPSQSLQSILFNKFILLL